MALMTAGGQTRTDRAGLERTDGTSGVRPRILHLTGDFPDPFDGGKTRVIRNLVEMTADKFDHRVISINRISPAPTRLFTGMPGIDNVVTETKPFEYGEAVRYSAPGRGLYHRTMLYHLGDWIAARIAASQWKPDLLVGHKLTIEGIAIRRAAKRLGLPYALSIQGDTDTRILGFRPDLAQELAAVLDGASMTFPFTPWAWEAIAGRLGLAAAPHVLLPCPTDIDEPLAPRMDGEGLVSVFHLRSFRRKNLCNLARAVALVAEQEPDVRLSVVGGGDARDVAGCRRLTDKVSQISLAGPMGREQVRRRLNAAAGFVLPSRGETFGLVFVEAMFAGTPVIYPRGRAIDGYFDGLPFAIPVDAKDPKSIAAAIREVHRNQNALKEALGEWQESDHAKTFRRPAIAAAFAEGLARAMVTTT